ncbi:PLAA [Branchiostoma lanceolatum]|uniref:Phospholipase A-2-activating protein n=1 Tax=Branchiostoma lanceolatum TaxID=7740 RepID=A0A8J9YXG9_BRALA|nr:PLAA [Branchiostoma lanceolatum]
MLFACGLPYKTIFGKMAASNTGVYKLRCSLIGHSMDVRAVAAAVFPDGAVVSASRDQTARLWAPNSDDNSFMEAHVMTGHSKFISSVCLLPPSDDYPHGMVVTGSNDHSIHIYSLESPEPVYKLTGHKNTVCSLAAGKFGTLLSGSWDKTARVWLKDRCMMTLSGHEAAVWAVAIMPEHGIMLTGSADKTIKMWRTGKCELTFTGHEDCVRSLSVVSNVEFLSASNDGSIRRWLTTGECTQVYYGHTNYVYSLAMLPNGQDFVTSGEDRTVRVWKGGECVQTITLQAQSVWSVACLSNGDIAVGASDNVTRVFTCAPERYASPEEIKEFEEQVASSTIPAKAAADMDGININELPGKEDLENPGTKEGQTKLVRSGMTVEAYQWSVAQQEWTKIGDVVGSDEGAGGTATGEKVWYEGKEYDHVFTVDLGDGSPKLKLPYNLADDPWLAAHNFLEKNELSQLYLDQVAKFILENTKGLTVEPAPGAQQYADPFTGANRYVPGSAAPTDVPQQGQGSTLGSDPLTGGGRYIPSYTARDMEDNPPAQVPQPTNPYFPRVTPLLFEQANPGAIVGKIKEFNGKVPAEHQLDESGLDQINQLLAVTTNQQPGAPTAMQMNTLWKILQWPKEVVFPALDVLRLALRHCDINQHFCNSKDGPQFLTHLQTFLSPDSPPANQMLALRAVCNMFAQPVGKGLAISQHSNILATTVDCSASTNKNVRIAMATIILNFAAVIQDPEDIEGKSQCLSAVATLLDGEKENEACFRLLVALGSLMVGDDNAIALARSLDLLPVVARKRGITEAPKVGECARFVHQLLDA